MNVANYVEYFFYLNNFRRMKKKKFIALRQIFNFINIAIFGYKMKNNIQFFIIEVTNFVHVMHTGTHIVEFIKSVHKIKPFTRYSININYLQNKRRLYV